MLKRILRIAMTAVYALAVAAASAGPALAEKSIVEEGVVIGEQGKPQPPTRKTSYGTVERTNYDPGVPNRTIDEGASAVKADEQKPAPTAPASGTSGRKKEGGFPWWILLVLGVAAAAGS